MRNILLLSVSLLFVGCKKMPGSNVEKVGWFITGDGKFNDSLGKSGVIELNVPEIQICWCPKSEPYGGRADIGFLRVNNGTVITPRDLKLRRLLSDTSN